MCTSPKRVSCYVFLGISPGATKSMDLRPRKKLPFPGFTKAEVARMEQFLYESKEQSLDDGCYKKLARVFNRSSGRAGKPPLKWTEVQSWFQKHQQKSSSQETSSVAAKRSSADPEARTSHKAPDNPNMPEGEKDPELSRLEFEARSSKDGAWYDVNTFLAHRFLGSGDIEVRVRYVGFGAEEDEWVNTRTAVRLRSIPLEHSECHKVKVGDLVVCFQERQDQARYYDAHIVDIQRRLHDIRGCRCVFLIKYDNDNSEEKVRLRRLCYRPNTIAQQN
ncbi:protein SAWADEE HOMEODOMAIN HOMOLOG 1-like [Primulina huaijiensis]|uniref:protein SAWADEE HOMEODOMAIN HOMOLOG 1-like n=1 Tax=Primulina huaijiensis TaxID=1492673 RepID=UPI003CC763CB